jgi:glycosyltransferase involved in cell wall biosynthesis
MKSICFVNTAYIKKTIGGAEVQMYLLAKAFIANGWEVFYVSADVDKGSVDEGIHLIPLNKSLKYPFDYRHFCHVLNKVDADFYYQRGRKALTYYLSKYCKQYNKKYVYATSMDIDTKRFKQVSKMSFKKPLSCIKNIIPAIINDYNTLKGIKRANLVLAQTDEQKKEYKEKRGINSIVLKKIYPDSISTMLEKSDPPTILWVANIKSWKQPELFIKLAEDLKETNCNFIMAGDLREKDYLPLIQSCTNVRFSFLGRVEYLESNDLFRRASIFVNTSLNYESEPNTYIESWLNQVPVVALNHDPDNVIKTKKLGFHSKSYDQLVFDVKKLIEDPELRQNIGKRAKQFASETYSQKNFNELLKYIDDINISPQNKKQDVS